MGDKETTSNQKELKNPPVKWLNEIEASKLSDIEFFLKMDIGILKELSDNYKEMSGNYNSMKKEIETINKNQEEIKNTISQIKNMLEGIIIRLDETED